MFKIGLHDPFEHLQHKLWQKKKSGVKLLTPKHKKSRIDLTPCVQVPCVQVPCVQVPCVQVLCNTLLESLWWELQLCFKLHPNQRFERGVIVSTKLQESKLWQFRNSPLGVLGQKNHLDVGLMERHKEYYMGEGVGFPRVRAMVSLMNLRSPVARPNTKGCSNHILINLLVGLM
jgi:hypothetical protein